MRISLILHLIMVLALLLTWEDLVVYTGLAVIPDNPFDTPSSNPTANPILDPAPLNFPSTHTESIDAIVVWKIVFTRDSGVLHLLVRWRG